MPFDPSEIDLFDPANGLPEWLSGGSASDTAAPLLAGLTDIDLGAALGALAPPEVEPPAPPEPQPASDADGWSYSVGDVAHAPDDGPDARTFRFHVRNASGATDYECVAEFPLPPACRGVMASHGPLRTATGLRWEFGGLKPGALLPIEVRVPLTAASRALAREPVRVRIGTRPLLAQLSAQLELPSAVPAGAPVPAVAVLTNAGRGTCAAGELIATCGALSARAALPALAPGAACRVPLELPPARVGTVTWNLTASAGAARARAAAAVTARAAELRVTLVAPARVELDEEIDVRVRVENVAPVPATGTRVALTVPEELVFRGAGAGGALAVAGDRAEWDVGPLAPGAAWEATVRFAGFAPGRPRLVARANCDTGPDAASDARLACELRRAGGSTLAELLAGLKLPAAAPAAPPASAARRETGARCLVVRTGRTRFALPLPSVRDALRPLPLTALPGAPEWVAGVCNVRGDIVTAIDLAAFLDLGAEAHPRGLVVVTAGELVFGLLVDDIVGIRAPADSGAELPDGPLNRFLTGAATDPNGLLHRLDPGALLAALESDLCEPARA